MPKEIVYGESFCMAADGESGEITQPVAVVRWNREGDVQLVTREHAHEVPPIEEHDPWIPATYGYHVTLDRTSINELIRHLRRARDQAFGRDE